MCVMTKPDQVATGDLIPQGFSNNADIATARDVLAVSN